jgi:phage repressor protein C with HTH and peptisase S24 domain
MQNIVSQRFGKCILKLKESEVIRSARQFALALDYLPQSLSEVLKGRRDAPLELIRKAIEVYKINPYYIFTGEGTMFLTDEKEKDFRVLAIVTDTHNEERIVYVPVPAQAGYAAEWNDPVYISELPTFSLPDFRYKVGTYRAFDVAGDSMEPTLYEGDKVVCSFVESTFWESIVKDHFVYVIVTKGDVVVKRIISQLKEKKRIVLVSDNDFYEPYPVQVSEIREIWQVRSRISPFMPSPSRANNQIHHEISDLYKIIQDQTQVISQLNNKLEKYLT